ncbi:MAG: phospholipase [Planctomycetota bacterium]|nr:phospholipase [Planctomycetota bacterium]MDA1213391.1 phospholipase [Planctomycetota bacterium]
MLKHTIRNYSGLRCHILDADHEVPPPRQVVVLCHGFGAPGTDLVPLAGELFAADPEWGSGTQFVFPEAPLELDAWGMPGSRAWWLIDMMRLAKLNSREALQEFVRECPDGMDTAANSLSNAVADILSDAGLPASRCVLGGFSQGAMISTQIALHWPVSPAGLCILSGSLINADDWEANMASRPGFPVFQSHGSQDPILPYQGAEWLREKFQNAGTTVDFHAFSGGHTITGTVLENLSHFLRRVL